ncbi:MAG TPA: Hsp20/alpha crystallin family protein [Longimicrobium sp.]|nr:Hsp20/alpha crystallin family protein [Longimicrobium sp.]
MAIMPYRPSADLFRPLFEDFLTPLSGWGGRMGQMARIPSADVIETENDIRVVMELPGMSARDVNVDLEGSVLTVSGEKREDRTEGDERSTWHLAERRYGRFSRSLMLPREVEQDGVQARFDDGVLTITVPKTENARRRRIEIGGNGQQRLESGETRRG